MTFGWHKKLRRTKSLAKPAIKPAILYNLVCECTTAELNRAIFIFRPIRFYRVSSRMSANWQTDRAWKAILRDTVTQHLRDSERNNLCLMVGTLHH